MIGIPYTIPRSIQLDIALLAYKIRNAGLTKGSRERLLKTLSPLFAEMRTLERYLKS